MKRGRAGVGTPVSFIKGPGMRYCSVLHRRDGVSVELVAGGYNRVGGPAGRVPHDLAHFLVEEEFGLTRGLWSLLASGALLGPRNTRVLAGRQPPHAERRSREILERAGEGPAQAEMVVRAVADLALAGRHRDTAALRSALGERWALAGITPDQLETACRRLQEAGARWEALALRGALDLVWHLT